MELTLDRNDLKPEYREVVICSQIKFEHFNTSAQKAIEAVGQATFFEFDHNDYSVIYSPT